MRILVWSVAAVLLTAAALVAQQQPPPVRPAVTGQAPALVPNAQAVNAQLDNILVQWSQRMQKIQALQAHVTRIEEDRVLNKKDEFNGWVRFLRPDRVDLFLVPKTNPPQNPSNPEVYERFLCTGKFLYEFKPENKLIRSHTLPQRAPGQPALDNSFLNFLFGMDPNVAKDRFDIKLVKQDQNYNYFDITPRLPADAADFRQARLALFSQNMPNAFLPCQMILVQPNGSTLTWNVGPTIDPAANIPANYFVKPPLPPGWKFVDQPPPAAAPRGGLPAPPANLPPPKTVRQSGGG